MESTKIVWHDPDILSPENSGYLIEYLSPLQYNAFTTVPETVQFLTETTDKWILVTSGANGRELVQQVHDFPSVIGIIIFCMNYNYHKEWSSAFNKVKKVETRSFKNVIKQARNIWDKLVTYNALSMTQKGRKEYGSIINALELSTSGSLTNLMISDSFTNRAYYHMEEELEMSFLQICKLSLKNRAISRSAVLNELKSFVLIDEDKERVERAFGKYPFDLLRSFVYVYTTHLVFQRLNECYALNDYSRVMNITAACLLELKYRPELMLQNPTVLYRGVNIPENDLKLFSIGDRGFWPAFTSASIREEVARMPCFDATVIFEIHLQANEPHPHILVQSWSECALEQEVLLLPYFPLVITNIKKIDKVTYITAEQDSTHPSLAFNSQTLINYWRPRIEAEVIVPIDNICDKIRQKAISIVDLPAYFKTDLDSENPEMPIVKDFTKIVLEIYKNNEARSLSESSLYQYFNRMENEIADSIIFYIKKRIERIFDLYFESIKSNIIKIMSYEAITTFSIHSDMLRQLIRKIYRVPFCCKSKKVEISLSGYRKTTSSTSYINSFIRDMVKGINRISIYTENLLKTKMK